ncbi:hypothetical protein Zm00014a_012896 [Zea mays]|uniref:Uncharacterized protein n=1 Tax=Zea mays TaxID=4577 RepID=A0A3L6D8B1_MAIZE|nr:hypothetical protein Zm00014a_012896 [Zea mays]
MPLTENAMLQPCALSASGFSGVKICSAADAGSFASCSGMRTSSTRTAASLGQWQHTRQGSSDQRRQALDE